MANEPNHNQKDWPPDEQGRRFWQRTATAAAVTAGLFSLIVSAVLIVNFLRQSPSRQLLAEDAGALDNPQLIEWRSQLHQDPHNESLKQRIRGLDMQLRQDYFWRQGLNQRGGTLLLIGAAVFLIGLRLAESLRQRRVEPGESPLDAAGQRRFLSVGRWAVAAVGLVLAGSILGLALRSDESTLEAAFAALTLEAGAAVGGQATLAGGDYPDWDQLQQNWPRFRGPGGLGVRAEGDYPLNWNGESGAGIAWKSAESIKPGNSSPIVWEDRVFINGADLCPDPNLAVYCFDAASGELLWQQSMRHSPAPGEDPLEIYEDTGLAANTMVTDGRRAFAIFATGDLVGYDFQGNRLWSKALGVPDSVYGYATSLIMYRNLLLVQLDQGEPDDDKSVLYAFEAQTGNVAWQKQRPVAGAWTTPIIIRTPAGEQCLTCSDPLVISYDPADGRELWRADLMGSDVAPSPIAANGLVFVVQPYDSLYAIRPDGAGDVTKTHVAWKAEDGIPDIASPVAANGYIYLLDTGGYLTCYALADGKQQWQQEVPGGEFQSSPTLVGDRLYMLSREGVMVIAQAAPSFSILARSPLGEISVCSPAFCRGRIYIRGRQHLFCIGKSAEGEHAEP
ncbi:MAG: PQQ-binding-like beta-propeller repeat protein [Sedimentisphaerales bacterium]|nr:PQQ-binding-like beta-propeller repeat protein [Sedimentisphaerales bacterium]